MNRLLLALCVMVCLSGGTFADEPSFQPKSVEDQLLEKLQQPITIEFTKTSLEDALHFFQLTLEVPVVIDEAALAEEAIDPDTPITRREKNIPGELALNIILRDFGLEWLIQDEVILVTSELAAEDLQRYGCTRVYDVSVLIDSILQHPQEENSGAFCTYLVGSDFLVRNQQIPHTKEAPIDLTDPARFESKTATAAQNDLAECLKWSISAPWIDIEGDGGTITSFRQYLVVRQSWQGQREIASLLHTFETLIANPPQRLSHRIGVPTYPHALDAKIERALPQPIEWEFLQTPLKDVVDLINNTHQIRVVLDEAAMAEEAIDPDTPITFRMQGISLGAGLNLLLRPMGLAWVIQEGRLVITTQYAAEDLSRYGMVRIYDLRPLKLNSFSALKDQLQSGTPGPWLETDGDGGGAIPGLPGFVVIYQTQHNHQAIAELLKGLSQHPAPDPKPAEEANPTLPQTVFYSFCEEKLVEDLLIAIPEFIAPGSWKTMGGEGTIRKVGSTLAIRQTPAVHREIRNWLEQYFEQARQQMVSP